MSKKAQKWISLVSSDGLQLFLLFDPIQWDKKAIFGIFQPFLVIFGALLSGPQKGGESDQNPNFLSDSGRLGLKLLFKAIKTIVEG